MRLTLPGERTMRTNPRNPNQNFLAVEDTRSRLDRVFIVRISPELGDRVAVAIRENPALAGLSRSEFARRAMIFALESMEGGSSAQGISG